MLHELVIENYAVVERLRLRLHPGLNVLTGETGSGKSIVVDALSLLLGGRASADMVRSGAGQARISGIFSVTPGLDLDGFQVEDNELLVEREVLAEGKSRAYVNNRPATVTLLKQLAPYLGDIHGQHEQQSLFAADAQLQILDSFAGIDRSGVAGLYQQWRECGDELAELERSEQEKLRLLDLWTFQRQEIETVNPQAGEDGALEDERRVLMNLGRVQENAGSAYAALYEAPESAYSQMRVAQKRIDDLLRIDSNLGPVAEAVQSAAIQVQEASYVLRDYLSRLEASPERLDEVEERLSAFDKLKRKYGSRMEEVLAYLAETRQRLEALEHSGERMAELRKRREDLAGSFEKAAAGLTRRRIEAGLELARRIAKELSSLAMERATFQAQVTPAPWSPSGADAAMFLFSANAGEEPKPLDKVASGGELSRIALAVKTCAGGKGASRTLVFDEVDAGVSGRAAEGIGRRLKKLGERDQVLCVTHLAQVAGFADHHYRVSKKESKGRTVASVEELDRNGRVQEVGRLLSGATLTQEALRQAEKLIQA
jgi:DNA repair protein RecN (Recombination protein N)